MKLWQSILTAVLAVAALAWVLHDVDASAFVAAIAGIRWSWVALGLVFDILSYACQGYRWSILFPSSARLSPFAATKAIYIGLFTNEVMPLRLGEFVRAWLASRWTGLRLAVVVPTLALERLMDALWLAASVGAAALFVHLPPMLERAAWILAGVAALSLLALAALLVHPTRHPRLRRLRPLRRQLLAAARSGALSRGFLASGALLAAQILAFYFIQRACSLPFGLGVAAVVLLIVHLGTAIPNTPANVGSYQFFVVFGLTLFGADKTAAAAFSLVVFVLLTLPLWLLGFLALRSTGATLAQLRSQAAAA